MYRSSFFYSTSIFNTASLFWGKKRKAGPANIPHIASPSSTSCSAREGDYCCSKKRSGHSGGIITAVQLTPTPLSVSLLLCVPVFEAPADSVCIHPYINHCPYSIGYMVHGKYWFFPLPRCWRTHGFCETENVKKKKKISGDLVKGQKWQARKVLFLRFVWVKNLCLLYLHGSQKVVACLIPAAFGRDPAWTPGE